MKYWLPWSRNPRGTSRPALAPRFIVVGAASVLAATLALSLVFEAAARRMLTEASTESLRSSATLFERLHASYYPALLLLSRSPGVAAYLSNPSVDKYAALRALEEIDAAAAANDLIHSVYVYRKDVGVLSTRRGWEPMTAESDVTLTAFMTAMRKSDFGRYRPRRVTFVGDSAPTNVLSLAFGVVSDDGTGMHKALVVNLKADRIRQILVPPSGVTDLTILSSEGKILSHANPLLFGADSSADVRMGRLVPPEGSRAAAAAGSSLAGSSSALIDGERWFSAWIDRPETGWRFVSLVRANALFGPLERIRDAIAIIAAAAVGLVSLFSIAASRGYLRRLRRDELLASSLAGLADFQESERDAGRPLLPAEPLRAAVVRICALRSLEARLGAQGARETREAALAAARDAAHAEFACALPTGEILILLRGTEAAALAALQDVAERLKARLDPRLPAGTFLLFPGALPADELPAACRRLVEGARAAYRQPPAAARLFDPSADANGAEVDFDAAMLAGYEAALRSGHPDAARADVTSLLAAAVQSVASEASFRVLVDSLVLRSIRAFSDEAEALLPGGAAAFRRGAAAAETVEEVRSLFLGVCDAAARSGELSNGQRRREICRQVREVVMERLRDRTLGTAAIAEAVRLSPHYLRELFRQVEGVSLMQYIGLARVEESKRLLRETDRPVRELFADAGFISYSYFFTYFKKATGVTPSDYRAQSRGRVTPIFPSR